MGWMDVIDNVGYVMDTPRALSHGAIAKLADAVRGKRVRDNWRESGRGMLEALGVLGKNQDGFDMGDAAGFAAEMALDPLNLIGGGIATKMLLGKRAGEASDQVSKLGKLGRPVINPEDTPMMYDRVVGSMMGDRPPSVLHPMEMPKSPSPIGIPYAPKPVVDQQAIPASVVERKLKPKKPQWERPDIAPGQPLLYSRLERAAEWLPDGKIKAPSVINQLKKYPEGVSQEEIDWTGLTGFLQGKSVVDKQDLVDYVRKNRPQIRVSGGDEEYHTYVQGKQNQDVIYRQGHPSQYRESLLKWMNGPGDPNKIPFEPVEKGVKKIGGITVVDMKEAGDNWKYVKASLRGIGSPWEDGIPRYVVMESDHVLTRTDDLDEAGRLAADAAVSSEAYKSPHFRGDDILAHGRSTVRDTPLGRTYLGEEQQSDWLQAAKKHGFQGDPVPDPQWTSIPLDRGEKLRFERGDYFGEVIPPVEGIAWQAILNGPVDGMQDAVRLPNQTSARNFLERQSLEGLTRNRVPRAPMADAWPDLVLKQQLIEAAQDPRVRQFGLPSGKDVQAVVGGEGSGQAKFYDQDQVSRVNRLIGDLGGGRMANVTRDTAASLGRRADSYAKGIEGLVDFLQGNGGGMGEDRLKAAKKALGDVITKKIGVKPEDLIGLKLSDKTLPTGYILPSRPELSAKITDALMQNYPSVPALESRADSYARAIEKLVPVLEGKDFTKRVKAGDLLDKFIFNEIGMDPEELIGFDPRGGRLEAGQSLPSRSELAAKIMEAMRHSYPVSYGVTNQVPLTPSIKKQILTKGFPLMSLLGLNALRGYGGMDGDQ